MKKLKKYIATMLSVVMLCTIILPNVAHASNLPKLNPVIENLKTKVSKDIVYVDDGNGKMIPVEITETIYYNSNSGMVPKSFSPLAKIGETRSYTVKVSNEMMGIPGTVGTGLSFVAKKAAAQVVSKAIAAKLGAGFIPGLNFVTWELGVAALANAISGKSGIEITVGLKYTETYLHKEGYSVNGWSPTSLSVRRH